NVSVDSDRANTSDSQIEPVQPHTSDKHDSVVGGSERSDANTESAITTDFKSSAETTSEALQGLDMSAESIARCQALDSDLKPFIDFLSNGTLPQSQKKARSVLLQQSDYALINGLLFHSRIAKSKRTKSLTQYQLALPKSLIPTVLKLYHDSAMGAHGGIHDTIDKIQEHYYFLQLTVIVSDYVKSCSECQKRKVTRVQSKNAITAYPTPLRPFSVWQMDLYGPIPVTSRGYSYIFTAVDMFSKFLYTKPLLNKDAMSVSEVLFEMFTTFGVCDTLISDQGSEFTARVTKELCCLLQIPQQFSLSFVHHTLGACERTHRTLASRLTPYMNKQSTNWDQYLPAVVFAMNCAVSASTGYSPFEVIFGARPKFPLSSHSSDLSSVPVSIRDYLRQKLAHINVIQQQVKANVERSQQIMLDRANEKSALLQLSEGDYVFLSRETTGPARKLHDIFDGPYIVKSVPSPHTVVLHDPENKRKFPRPLHLDRLKIAYVRQPTPSNYFSVVTHAPELVYISTGTQTVTPDIHIYTQDTEVDSVESTGLSSQDESNVENKEDMHSSRVSTPISVKSIETETQSHPLTPVKSFKTVTQSPIPISVKSIETETHSHPLTPVKSFELVTPLKSPSRLKPQETETHKQSPGSVFQEPAPQAETRTENVKLHNIRPRRIIVKPKRFRDSDHVNLKDYSVSSEPEFYRIKRVLAQRKTPSGLEYLVHFAGEPAQNAIWIPDSDLNVKAKAYVKNKSIPFI
ncbi:MAG: DDE-type integrase/transposase/recombinase, partial [Candidatus Thiodiazotropha sp.]